MNASWQSVSSSTHLWQAMHQGLRIFKLLHPQYFNAPAQIMSSTIRQCQECRAPAYIAIMRCCPRHLQRVAGTKLCVLMMPMRRGDPMINVSIDMRDPKQLNACSICMGSLISEKNKRSAKYCRVALHTPPSWCPGS